METDSLLEKLKRAIREIQDIAYYGDTDGDPNEACYNIDMRCRELLDLMKEETK